MVGAAAASEEVVLVAGALVEAPAAVSVEGLAEAVILGAEVPAGVGKAATSWLRR